MTSFVAQGIGSGVYGWAVELGTAVSWNPLHAGTSSIIFSNLYLILVVLHVGILFVYRVQFIPRNASVSTERGIQ